MFDKDYLIENITEQNIITLFEKYGEKPYKNTDSELWFKTICHPKENNKEKSHKLCYFKATKTFFCYTRCGFMSVFSLVMTLENCNFSESLNFIAKLIGVDARKGLNIFNNNSKIKKELNTMQRYIGLRKKQKKSILHLPCINDKILKYFENDVFYKGWIEEGISINTMEYFNISWYELEKYIIIPHYNIKGKLIGIRRRSLQEKDKKNKYMPLILEGVTYTHSLNLNFYGLNKNLQAIKKFKKVVIVESEKSVMLSYEYYKENAFVIATCGFNISNWHRDLLLSLGIEEVIIAFDKDYDVIDYETQDKSKEEEADFNRYVKRIYSLAYKFSAYFRTYVIWDRFKLLNIKDSPFDKGKETLEFLMKNKIEITTNREE